MPLRVLFLDMNSFFASVEQQVQPKLRGRPIAVAAVDVDSTCCIAVSREAKNLGVRRGMSVGEARKYDSLVVVEARPPLYVQFHHAIVEAVESCIPVSSVDSIDELSCRLSPSQTEPARALELAHQIKRTIHDRVGAYLRCSVGLAPNKFLAKVASGMRKSDGLFVIQDEDLPGVLYPLALDDLPGIGRRMLARLQAAHVTTVERLCELTEREMKAVWHGVVGQRWWHWLRGYDLPESRASRRTIGHSHVLPPPLRTQKGACEVLLRLIHKAAVRLRNAKCRAGRLEVYVSYSFREEGWSGSVGLGSCQDTLTIIEAFDQLWRCRPSGTRPVQVAVTLYDLVPESTVSLPLFSADRQRLALAQAMDQVNQRFGVNAVYFGGIHDVREAAPTRIAFTQIPDCFD